MKPGRTMKVPKAENTTAELKVWCESCCLRVAPNEERTVVRGKTYHSRCSPNSTANREVKQDCHDEMCYSEHRTGGRTWMSESARSSARRCSHLMDKPSFTAGVFRTSLRKSTPWSTPECCRVGRKESKLRFLGFLWDSSSPIAIWSGPPWTGCGQSTFRTNEAPIGRYAVTASVTTTMWW